MINTKITKTRFEKLYRSEHNTSVKERMLLVLYVIYQKQIPAQVARDLHRSRTWASDWLNKKIPRRKNTRIKKQIKEW